MAVIHSGTRGRPNHQGELRQEPARSVFREPALWLLRAGWGPVGPPRLHADAGYAPFNPVLG